MLGRIVILSIVQMLVRCTEVVPSRLERSGYSLANTSFLNHGWLTSEVLNSLLLSECAWLRNQKMTVFPLPSYKKMSRLKYLYLDDNDIEKIPHDLAEYYPHLEVLSLKNNIVVFCRNKNLVHPNLKELYITTLEITNDPLRIYRYDELGSRILSSTFNLPKLKILEIAGSWWDFNTLAPGVFKHLVSLESFKLTPLVYSDAVLLAIFGSMKKLVCISIAFLDCGSMDPPIFNAAPFAVPIGTLKKLSLKSTGVEIGQKLFKVMLEMFKATDVLVIEELSIRGIALKSLSHAVQYHIAQDMPHLRVLVIDVIDSYYLGVSIGFGAVSELHIYSLGPKPVELLPNSLHGLKSPRNLKVFSFDGGLANAAKETLTMLAGVVEELGLSIAPDSPTEMIRQTLLVHSTESACQVSVLSLLVRSLKEVTALFKSSSNSTIKDLHFTFDVDSDLDWTEPVDLRTCTKLETVAVKDTQRYKTNCTTLVDFWVARGPIPLSIYVRNTSMFSPVAQGLINGALEAKRLLSVHFDACTDWVPGFSFLNPAQIVKISITNCPKLENLPVMVSTVISAPDTSLVELELKNNALYYLFNSHVKIMKESPTLKKVSLDGNAFYTNSSPVMLGWSNIYRLLRDKKAPETAKQPEPVSRLSWHYIDFPYLEPTLSITPPPKAITPPPKAITPPVGISQTTPNTPLHSMSPSRSATPPHKTNTPFPRLSLETSDEEDGDLAKNMGREPLASLGEALPVNVLASELDDVSILDDGTPDTPSEDPGPACTSSFSFSQKPENMDVDAPCPVSSAAEHISTAMVVLSEPLLDEASYGTVTPILPSSPLLQQDPLDKNEQPPKRPDLARPSPNTTTDLIADMEGALSPKDEQPSAMLPYPPRAPLAVEESDLASPTLPPNFTDEHESESELESISSMSTQDSGPYLQPNTPRTNPKHASDHTEESGESSSHTSPRKQNEDSRVAKLVKVFSSIGSKQSKSSSSSSSPSGKSRPEPVPNPPKARNRAPSAKPKSSRPQQQALSLRAPPTHLSVLRRSVADLPIAPPVPTTLKPAEQLPPAPAPAPQLGARISYAEVVKTSRTSSHQSQA
ncbi:hypothetical protein NEDG_01471 [Nematocida displodere]|uniref:Uncharacterized protein n=1 Tax=Nematocida displodere TaxID=1805483 RepID=A0A177ED96_9MICR|nr:hypothetical protein NEDG_01471 [Nematocida displodere]